MTRQVRGQVSLQFSGENVFLCIHVLSTNALADYIKPLLRLFLYGIVIHPSTYACTHID